MGYVYYKDQQGKFRWRFQDDNNRSVAESALAYEKVADFQTDIALLKASAEATVTEQPASPTQSKNIKRLSLAALLVVATLLLLLAFALGARPLTLAAIKNFFTLRFENLTAREWAVLLTPAFGAVIATLTHYADWKWKGGGIRHRVKEIAGGHYQVQADVAAATMTKQSVLAAIAAILLTIVQTARHAGTGPGTPLSFPTFAAELSTVGFLASIVLLLVSMKCYDYANRFNLHQDHKEVLLKKGLNLDIYSWYLLLYSFGMASAIISETLSIVLTIVIGILLWWYYFIHVEA